MFSGHGLMFLYCKLMINDVRAFRHARRRSVTFASGPMQLFVLINF